MILILGLGEDRRGITDAMRDLYNPGCELPTIAQYLRPSARHHGVERWVPPEEFAELREEALAIGSAGVMSGPLVRSSAPGQLYREAIGPPPVTQRFRYGDGRSRMSLRRAEGRARAASADGRCGAVQLCCQQREGARGFRFTDELEQP